MTERRQRNLPARILHEKSPKTPSKLWRRTFFCWRRREFGGVDRDILLGLFDLDSEARTGAGDGPAERNLYSTSIAIIRVIDLGGIESERTVAVANHANQQSRLRIEVQHHGWLTLAQAAADSRLV